MTKQVLRKRELHTAMSYVADKNEFLVPAANSEDGPRTYEIVRASTGTMIFCITYAVAAIELMNNPAFNCTIFHYSPKENIKDKALKYAYVCTVICFLT